MSRYAQLLSQHVGERDISKVAEEWGVPAYVLYDGLRQKTKSPSSQYVTAVAQGCGMSVEAFLAYIGEKQRQPSPNGGRRGKATAST